MKRLLVSLIALLTIVCACKSGDSKIVDPVVENLKERKFEIDSSITDKSLLVFAKVAGKQSLIEVKGRRYPPDIELTYNVLKDERGRVIYVAEMPYSADNNWFIVYKSYFNPEGKLLVFQRQNNFMHSKCVKGAAMESLTKYYGPDFSVLDSSYTLTDTKKQPLDKVKCEFPYNFPFEVYTDLDDLRKAKGVKEF